MDPEIPVIYEDNHLLVVDKPQNMPVQPDISGDMDMLTCLKGYLKDKYNKPGNVFLGLVHRLDRPAGGVMVFARTSKAASRLTDQLRHRFVKKIYLAVVHGKPKPVGTLTHFLYKDRDANLVEAVPRETKGAKKALLHFTTLETAGNLSLVMITLETGRSHQIRVQFSKEGYPLWGDYKYGNVPVGDYQQLALYSHKLQLEHPTQRKSITFETLPPEKYPWSEFQYLQKIKEKKSQG
ncbi:MAG TPA: RluA family pseudouridine synthase [Balneolales bacterium]|nr:RluA family pseudouridine synthase [Balneolales bacterium]